MSSDPIADFLVQLVNASRVGKLAVIVPHSNSKQAIAEVLTAAGFVKTTVKKGKQDRKFLEIELIYNNKRPKIAGVLRVSKPSRRVYLGYGELRPFRQGYGQLILSTPRGVLTGEDARAVRVGGEVLFKIW